MRLCVLHPASSNGRVIFVEVEERRFSETTVMPEEDTLPPWPYQTLEEWRRAKKEEQLKEILFFYPDFDDDVFAGVL